MIIMTIALVFTAFGWYKLACITLIVGILMTYLDGEYPTE